MVSLLDPDRRAFLAAVLAQSEVIERGAVLGPALLLAVILLRLLRYRDPIAGLGLDGGAKGATELLAGLSGGVVAHLLLLVAVAACGVPSLRNLPAAAQMALLKVAAESLRLVQAFPPAALMAPVLALSYAVGRLAVSHAHVQALAARHGGETAAALAAAALFAVSYLGLPGFGALAGLNLFLLGLLLAVYRTRTTRLWGPLGLLGGWVLVGMLSGGPHQGMPLVSDSLAVPMPPAPLSGGAFGPEGGLIMTCLMSGWLAILLRPRRSSGATA